MRRGRHRVTAEQPDRLWREGELWVVDLETTGLDLRRDHIVSYGAVPIRDGRVRIGEAIYGLVKVRGPIPVAAARIHGIRTQDLCAAPSLNDAVAQLQAAINAHPIVAHCAVIERTLLRRAFRHCHAVLDNEFIDTAVLAASALDLRLDGAAVALEYAAVALGVPVHSPHHALGDAVTTANVFLASVTRLERERGGVPLTIAALVGRSRNRFS